jgi:hypothetical protein
VDSAVVSIDSIGSVDEAEVDPVGLAQQLIIWLIEPLSN